MYTPSPRIPRLCIFVTFFNDEECCVSNKAWPRITLRVAACCGLQITEKELKHSLTIVPLDHERHTTAYQRLISNA